MASVSKIDESRWMSNEVEPSRAGSLAVWEEDLAAVDTPVLCLHVQVHLVVVVVVSAAAVSVAALMAVVVVEEVSVEAEEVVVSVAVIETLAALVEVTATDTGLLAVLLRVLVATTDAMETVDLTLGAEAVSMIARIDSAMAGVMAGVMAVLATVVLLAMAVTVMVAVVLVATWNLSAPGMVGIGIAIGSVIVIVISIETATNTGTETATTTDQGMTTAVSAGTKEVAMRIPESFDATELFSRNHRPKALSSHHLPPWLPVAMG